MPLSGSKLSADNKVYVLALGLKTSLGSGVDENWRSLLAGASGVKRIKRFDVSALPVHVAATMDDDDSISPGTRCRESLREVIREAIANSGLSDAVTKTASVFLSAPTPDVYWQTLASRKAPKDQRSAFFEDECATLYGSVATVELKTRSIPVLVNTACASGATALEIAAEAIMDGETDLALVAGSDASVYDECLIKFCLLSALSTRKGNPKEVCRPFASDRGGFVMGEGAAAILLASSKLIEELSLTPIASILGTGNATDGFHRTRTHPNCEPIIQSMLRAIKNSELDPQDISYINTHGTGTPENDKMECMGIRKVFGEHTAAVPITSNKSQVGHTLTAAGLIEAAFSVMSIKDQVIPPTLNQETPDDALRVNVIGPSAQRRSIEHVLSNSFGFGGQNVSIVFSRVDSL